MDHISFTQLRSREERKTYLSWYNMRARCSDSFHPSFHNYGGRGILVCDKWKDNFLNFLEDMGIRPSGKSLDRIDNNGIYAHNNCRWATRKEQANNTRKKSPRIFITKPNNNTSGYIGVSWHKKSKKWVSRIQRNGLKQSIGYFDTLEQAKDARLAEMEKLDGPR